jgi:hypothetical protein
MAATSVLHIPRTSTRHGTRGLFRYRSGNWGSAITYHALRFTADGGVACRVVLFS